MIPVCEPTLLGNEKKYVLDCLETNWISSIGDYISKFEKMFAKFCGVNYGIACNNGTTALHLMIEAMNIGKGDEVIIPTFTMIATANAVIYSGAKPILIDSESETWNIDPKKIEEKITDKTKAIMVMHTYGHPCDMEAIQEIADKYNISIIEDGAEAPGAEYKNKCVGSLGKAAAFSFYANKIITTGEGGMVVTNNKDIAEKARLLRNHAFSKPRFLHKEFGFNYRMTNIQAAIGVAQMEYANELVEARIKNAKLYNNLLKDVGGITLPPKKEWVKNVYWMYGILIGKEFGVAVPEIRDALLKRGIDTRTFFIPMHKQPVYLNNKKLNFPDCSGLYPVADMLSEKGFYLPSSSSLKKDQIKQICEILISLKK
jgi:perosamine synthetase